MRMVRKREKTRERSKEMRRGGRQREGAFEEKVEEDKERTRKMTQIEDDYLEEQGRRTYKKTR